MKNRAIAHLSLLTGSSSEFSSYGPSTRVCVFEGK